MEVSPQYTMRKPNELPEAFMLRMGNYFSGTAREEYYCVAKERKRPRNV